MSYLANATLRFHQPRNEGVIASNGQIHATVVDAIRQIQTCRGPYCPVPRATESEVAEELVHLVCEPLEHAEGFSERGDRLPANQSAFFPRVWCK